MLYYEYMPKGSCASMMKIVIDEDDDTLKAIAILGGCHGYLNAMMQFIKDKPVQELVEKLKGFKCIGKETSCPDQIANALQAYLDYKDGKDAEKLMLNIQRK